MTAIHLLAPSGPCDRFQAAVPQGSMATIPALAIQRFMPGQRDRVVERHLHVAGVGLAPAR